MSKTDKKREEFDKRFLVKKGYLEPDGDKVIFSYDGKKEKKFALVRGGYDELWNWIEKAIAQARADERQKVIEEVKKEFERFRNNLVTEDMNRELEEQLKTQK